MLRSHSLDNRPWPPAEFGWRRNTKYSVEMVLPLWAVTLFMVVTSTLPWLSWRFSLRTLLIATTLIAVVLGLIVWLSTRF
jgi:hypothetical protein